MTASAPPDPPVNVWYVSGNDTEDDPAWGFAPVRTGTADEIAAWLVGQPALHTLSITIGPDRYMWAREFLAERGLAARLHN